MKPTEAAWRSRLLGSLNGQLQLATFAVMFVGLTTASSLSLWLNQRRAKELHHAQMIDRAKEFDRCAGMAGNPHTVASTATDPHSQPAPKLHNPPTSLLQNCLNLHGGVGHLLWIDQGAGGVLTPDLAEKTLTDQIIRAGMLLNPAKTLHQTDLVTVDRRDFLTHLHHSYPNGMRLWTSEETTLDTLIEGRYLTWLILIWGSALLVMVLTVALLVRRIVSPLNELNTQLELMTAESLKSGRVKLEGAPQEIGQLTDAYNKLLDRLSDSWSQQRQFVSGVSHELRNPLMIVSGYLKRVLRRGSNLTEAQREQLQTAEEEAQRINRLIDDLLDLSRNDSGRLSIQREPVELQPLLEQVIDMLQTSSERPITLATPHPIGPDALRIEVNPDRFKQVLLNLIENAEKYSSAGSPILVELSQLDDAALIEVLDQGIGIPAADLPHVFDRFYRGSNISPAVGSGLGLSVVRLLVEAMGGSISVSSEPGQGSCFRMRFSLC